MPLEELKDQLQQFNFYKRLILDGMANGRNVIIERKDGTCAILHTKFERIPGMLATIDEVERITVFINGKEFEFVACQ